MYLGVYANWSQIFLTGLAEFFTLRLVILIVILIVLAFLPFVWWTGKPIMITIKIMIKTKKPFVT